MGFLFSNGRDDCATTARRGPIFVAAPRGLHATGVNTIQCIVAALGLTLALAAASPAAASYTLSQTFDDPTVNSGDFFGESVALDGNHALIGAPFDNTQGTNVGQAHLFDVTTGALLATFDARR